MSWFEICFEAPEAASTMVVDLVEGLGLPACIERDQDGCPALVRVQVPAYLSGVIRDVATVHRAGAILERHDADGPAVEGG